jgi:hypothetical protein
MNIKITDHLYLRSDQYCCWIVRTSTVKTGKSVGKEVEQIIGYYRSPVDALTELLSHRIRTSEATDLKEIISLVCQHNDLIRALVTDIRPKEIMK